MANAINSLNYGGNIYTFTLPYGSCSTAAATAAKTVTVSNFSLETGARIVVKFTVTNTAASPTLNVNSTGAKAIYYKGTAITASYLTANKTYEFIYNGTQWDLIGDVDTNSTYSLSSFGITATKDELNYCDGVTSNIQTQLNNKASSSHGTHVSYGTSASALGTSSAGSASTVSRSDHVHALPALTSCTGTLSIAKGGTGATDAATARTNLGLGSAATKNSTNTIADGGTALITSGAVYTGLAGKANSSHTHSYLPLSGGTLTGAFTGTSGEFKNSLSANTNSKTPFKITGNLYFMNKNIDWNTNSYIQHVILLIPVPTSTNWSGCNYFEGKFLLWKTGGNVYDVVDLSLNCVYNNLRYHIQNYGDHADWKLCVCKYNSVLYYALKCPYHANPYSNVEFIGHVKSTLTGGTNTVALPLDVPYYNEDSKAVLNSEVKNSLTDTLTTSVITSASSSALRSHGGFSGSLSGNASSASKLATARTISLTGSVTGSGSFDGSDNLSISTTTNHTHNYAGASSAGGSATSAVKLDTATAGSATQPVYFSGGKPVACTYTLGKSVPSDAKFTDTTYSAAGSSLGLVKSGGDVTISSGTITVNDDSHNHVISNIDGLQTALDGKASSSHGNHVPTTQTADNATFLRNDNTWQKVTPANIGAAAASHGTHVSYGTSTKALGTSSAGSASTVSRSDHVHALPALTSCTGTLSVAKGGTGATDAATARANIGAAASSHTHITVNGTYTSNGGAQPPSYVVGGTVRFNMMNCFKGLTNLPTYADCILMDTYTGSDVPYVTGFGIVKASGNPKAFIAVGEKGNTTTWASQTEIITAANIGSQTVSKAGTCTGNAATATNVAWSGVTSKPSYYDAKAIKGITRSGTTFTYTCMDGTTGTFTQQDNNTTYSAGTGISLSGTTFSNSGVRAISTGSENGTISVNTNGTVVNVKVANLGTAAYASSGAFALANHTHNYAASSHTHNYAGSSSAGGAATSAAKLNTNAGTAIRPVYFSGGIPVVCTSNPCVISSSAPSDTTTLWAN